MADALKPIHSYSDPGFNQQRFYEYELTIRMAADDFVYGIRDINTNKFLHLEAFDLSEHSKKPYIPGEQLHSDPAKVRSLLEGSLKWLGNPFSKTIVMLEQGKSTLVPEALYSEEDKEIIYNFNIAGGPFENGELGQDTVKHANACTIYHVNGPLMRLIEQHFPGSSIRHYSGIMIQLLLMKFRNRDNNNTLYVNTGSSHIDLLRIRDKRLDYFNSFIYNTAEDFMYYLVFVVEQLKLNPETVEIIMLGEVEKHSPLSDTLHKYIRNISFIERNADFRYSFVFDQLPGHYYYNLFNASLCE